MIGTIYNNPFLILLLHRLVCKEVEHWLRITNPTREEICTYIRSYKAHYEDNIAATFAIYYRNHIWKGIKNKNLNFSVRTLNQMCQLLGTTGRFEKWKDFVDHYQDHPFSIIGDDYTTKPFNKFPFSIQKYIEDLAEGAAALITISPVINRELLGFSNSRNSTGANLLTEKQREQIREVFASFHGPTIDSNKYRDYSTHTTDGTSNTQAQGEMTKQRKFPRSTSGRPNRKFIRFGRLQARRKIAYLIIAILLFGLLTLILTVL